MNELRFAFRQLLKSPGFTAVAVLTLALGIGANAGIFSLLYAIIWRPLPVKDPAGLINLHQGFAGKNSRYIYHGLYRVSYPEYLNYRDSGASVSDLIASEETTLTLGGEQASRDYKPVLRFADLNGDGNLGLVSANDRRNSIEIFLGDGHGGFSPGPAVKLEQGPWMFWFGLTRSEANNLGRN